MAAKLKTYDPDRLIITFGPVKLEGFAPDGRINFTPPVMFNKVEGTDGEVARGKTNASSIEIEIPLLHTSESNDALMLLFDADVGTPTGAPVPFFYQDLDGAETIIAPGAWIPQVPAGARKSAVGVNTWKIHTGPAQYFVGGHVKRV